MDVSRPDFVKSSFVAGVATDVAAGVVNGIFINENLDLEELAADKVYEFAWSFNPLPLQGAAGSPGNSVAIA